MVSTPKPAARPRRASPAVSIEPTAAGTWDVVASGSDGKPLRYGRFRTQAAAARACSVLRGQPPSP